MSTDWSRRAACRDEDPELFHPVGTSGPALLQIAEAKTVCRRCPASAECLRDALVRGLDHGVFGGLTEDERRALSPARKAALMKRIVPRPDPTHSPRNLLDSIERLADGGLPPSQIAMRLGVREKDVRAWLADAKESAA